MTQKDWSEYYKITKTKPPSKLLINALEKASKKDNAIDIGAGSLRDTVYLLQEGFDVTAVDKSPLILEESKVINQDKLHAFNSSYEDFDFPKNKFDIASAMFALPFAQPETFDLVFKKIKNSLNLGGIFCGQFFGIKDEWSSNTNMTFHTKDEIEKLFKDFEIILLNEEEKNDLTAMGKMKHWHIFHVIAKKNI